MKPSDLPLLESCDGCGLCCYTVSLPPFRIDYDVNEPKERHVPEELQAEFLPFWSHRFEIEQPPCLWFDLNQKKCRHYEIRPQACRDFEINSSACRAVRLESIANK